VARVQERGGVAADGTFDPDTRRAMQWPTATAQTTCVAGGSLGVVAEEAD
jgi:murein L,D-transpeptidase YcbB/YkuD